MMDGKKREHHFELKASWPGGRDAVGDLTIGNLQTKISVPAEFDGPGQGVNPDEMFFGAAGTCYLMTLGAMLERSSLDVSNLALTSTGIVEGDRGIYTCKKIIHRPSLTIKEEDDGLIRQMIARAGETCMLSKAIKGNVDVVIEAEIDVV